MSVKPLDLLASQAEYDAILKVLEQTSFNKSETAKILNIDRKTLYNKLKKYKKLKAKEVASQES